MSSDEELSAFLTARLDEDEAAAKTAASVAGPAWQFGQDFPTSYLRAVSGGILADTLISDDGQIGPHLARHDPARVLREVAAGRHILASFADFRQEVEAQRTARGDVGPSVWSGYMKLRNVVTLRAAVFSDHPSWRKEWAP